MHDRRQLGVARGWYGMLQDAWLCLAAHPTSHTFMIDNPITISISALPTITPHLAQSTSQVIQMQLFDIYRPWARVGAAAFSNRVQQSSN